MFLDPSPKVKEVEAKMNKQHLIKLRCFCTAKENNTKTKRQLTEWEKIFANNMTDKGLISNIYKQLIEFNIKKTNNSIKKRVEELNRHFSPTIADGQQKHEKMLNIANHQGNADQNHNEISLHICQNGYYQKDKK